MLSRGVGQVVSVLALYSDDPSSNPAVVHNFSVKLTKIDKKKRPGWPIFLKKHLSHSRPVHVSFIYAIPPLKL